jgi:outer membrane protein, heavy metal efflux system
LLVRRVAGGILVTTLAGCATYEPSPLPPLEALARPPALDEAALQARAAALQHPLVPSVPLDLADGIDPEEAAVLAVLLDPALVAARDTRQEAEANRITAELWPNPSFGAEVDAPYGSGSAGLVNVVNLVLSIDLRQLITRSSRVHAARADLVQVDLGVTWQEWLVAQQARLLALRMGWLERRLAILSHELELEERTQQRIEDAVENGDATYDQLGVQRASVETIRRDLIDLEQTAVSTRTALQVLLGEPGGSPLRVSAPAPPPDAIPAPPAQEAVVPQCLAARLDLAALRAGYQAQDERLRQAILEQLPNVTVGLVHQRNESSLSFFGGLVNLGLPAFDRNQGGVALARATRARLRDEYRSRATEVRSSVDDLLSLLAVFARRLPQVQAAIAPLAEIESSEQTAAESGDVDWLFYQTVRIALLDQRLQAASLAQARAEALVGLDTACGVVGGPWAQGEAGAP